MSSKPSAAPSNPRFGLTALRVVLLLAVIAITALVFVIRPQASRLAAYGYPGIFLISLLSSATIILPAPGVAVVFAMGSVFNPLLTGIAAGAGAAVGELSGYAAGFSGQDVVGRAAVYDRIVGWMRRYGFVTIFVLAVLPNPFFDVAGMAAGALKMPLWQFFICCLLGKILKMLAFAYTGAYTIDWLVRL